MPRARTLAEAYAYLELTLPPGEGWIDFDRFTAVERDGDGYLLRFAGPYEGRFHTVEVPVAGRSAPDEPDAVELSYGPGRSELVDPGQWYLIESGYAGMARTGLAELGGATPDDETYRAIHRAWDSARAAVREIEKFVPDGADSVPPGACWTEQGRWLCEHRAGAFRLARLSGAAESYRRQRDELAARYASAVPDGPGAAEPELTPALPAEAPVEAPATDPPAARTLGEAYVFMDLNPCECGSAQFRRGALDVLAGDDVRGLLVRYAGPCDGCGRPRDFRFQLPGRPELAPESPYLLSHPSDGPSVLLDPGDWLAAALAYGACADALEPAGVPAEDIVKLLTVAAGAVDEVLRFLPPGADAVPPGGFWTDTGREAYQRDPALFRRDRLVRERAERWARLGGFRAARSGTGGGAAPPAAMVGP